MEYCLLSTETCFSLTDWNNISVIIGTCVTVPSLLFAAWKTWSEIKKSRIEQNNEYIQRERDYLLKRIEFTLAQHRRLFDDEMLFSVLSLIDSDDERLSELNMWDAKRKLLTFFEEIGLLVNSAQIDSEVAYYMFGYYAVKAKEGDNFKVGIALEECYWGLFFEFCRKAELYLENYKIGDIKNLKL